MFGILGSAFLTGGKGMLLRNRIGLWSTIAMLLGSLFCGDPANSQSTGVTVKELLVSLVRPVEVQEPRETWGERIDLLISRQSWESRDQEEIDRSSVIGLPFRSGYQIAQREHDWMGVFPKPEDLFPGNESLDRLRNGLRRRSSLSPNEVALIRHGATVLDSSEAMSSVGSLAVDATGLYSRCEIQVETSTYTLRLFAVKRNGERKLIYTCRTGLGSAEYPTPRGSYYIIRIFDDNPLWIPPPDRPWAWGQSASHTVYGGHMMPFFSKKPLHRGKKAEVVRELDRVAGKMEMVDAGAYRIHGTSSPWSVGSNQSHGCVRLLNSSVKKLADALKMYVGTVERGRTANGTFVKLAKPVRLILYRQRN
jgi:L,D-transpeptidase ErfK/SrfK